MKRPAPDPVPPPTREVSPSRDMARGVIRRVPVVLCVAVALAALCLCGCFVARENVLADEALPGEHIRGIRRGATTRQEILDRFGPPVAVARRGTTMVHPPAGPAKRGRVEVPSDAFFELFSTGRALRDTEIVYYYDSSRLKATGFLLIPLVGGGFHNSETVVQRLWLLIDDGTGIVEDYVFRGGD